MFQTRPIQKPTVSYFLAGIYRQLGQRGLISQQRAPRNQQRAPRRCRSQTAVRILTKTHPCVRSQQIRRMTVTIATVRHLQPPSSCWALQCHRYKFREEELPLPFLIIIGWMASCSVNVGSVLCVIINIQVSASIGACLVCVWCVHTTELSFLKVTP